MARPRKNQAESSASSADEKATQATSLETPSPTDEVKQDATQPAEATPPESKAPASESTKAAEETDGQKKADDAPEIHPDIEATFKARTHIKCAYVSEDGKWFFDKRMAKVEFKQFKAIANPYHDAE